MVMTFSNIQYLAIYIKSNQKGTEITTINGIEIMGDETSSMDTTTKTSDDLFRHSQHSQVDVTQLKLYNNHKHSNCNVSAEKCDDIKILKEIMDEYKNALKKQRDINKFCDKYNDRIVYIMDKFNHLLSFHDIDQKEFNVIFNLFGGKCVLTKCNQFQTYYTRNREMESKNNDHDPQYKFIQDTFNKIHCYIHHQYDMGLRSKYNAEEEKCAQPSKKCLRGRIILRSRYLQLQNLSIKYKIRTNNKFSTDLNQVLIQNTTLNQQNETQSPLMNYSYSFPFIYEQHNYVYSKYQTFKEELLQNEIWPLESIHLWNGLINTAEKLRQTQQAKQYIAYTKYYTTNSWSSLHHPIHFGYSDGDLIEVEHLMAVRAYCEFDTLQYKFSQTFRKLNDTETLKDVIKRHCNYHHFAKYLKQATQVFGIMYQDCPYFKRFYHCINKQMIFDSTYASINGPLSTSWSSDVAAQFSNDMGMILELVPLVSQKYFNCRWISPYPAEGEILFMATTDTINIVNIVNTQTGDDWIKWIKPIRLIENMAYGYYFIDEPSDIHKIMDKDEYLIKGGNVSDMKLSLLSHETVQIFYYMVSHQLAKNGYNDLEKNIKLYPEIFDPIPYIEQLLNNICNKKSFLILNMTAMNTKVLKQVNNKPFGGIFGYIGYSFCSKVFLCDNYHGINLKVFNALFPNLRKIDVFELKSISVDFLNDIYIFLKNNASNISEIHLHVMKQEEDILDMGHKCALYQARFKSIGFHCSRMSGKRCLCITKIDAGSTSAVIPLLGEASQRKLTSRLNKNDHVDNVNLQNDDGILDTLNDIMTDIDAEDIEEYLFPNLHDHQQINDCVTTQPTRTNQKQSSKNSCNRPSNASNQSNDNKEDSNDNEQNNHNQHRKNNSNGSPNRYTRSSQTINQYQRGNCPFCTAANISFRLYLIHCDLEHPGSNHDMAKNFWIEYNKALSNKQFQSVPTCYRIYDDNQLLPISSVTFSTASSSHFTMPQSANNQNDSSCCISIQPASIQSASIQQQRASAHQPSDVEQFSDQTSEVEAEAETLTSYEPSGSNRARKNIFVSRQLMDNFNTNICEEHKNIKCYLDHRKQNCNCDGLYLWMDIDIAMQFNQKESIINNETKIFNCDITDQETKQNLYIVIERDKTKSKVEENVKKKQAKYPWKMRDELYTDTMIHKDFGVKTSKLPKPVRKCELFKKQMDQIEKVRSLLKEKMNEIIRKTKWCTVKIFSKINHKRRKALLVTKDEFVRDLNEFVKDETKNASDSIDLVPVIMFRKNEYEVQFLWIVQIDKTMSIGIALVKERKRKILRVRGIHVNKQLICKSHQWVDLKHMEDCKCLDNFNVSQFNYLKIGNPDSDANKLKDMTKRMKNLMNDLRVLRNNRNMIDGSCSPRSDSVYGTGKQSSSVPSNL